MKQTPSWIIVGSELSPYTLKLESMCRYVGLPYRTFPAAGNTFKNIRYLARKEAFVNGLLPQRWPKKNPLDEYPLVPFLFGPRGENLFDSSSIAEWIDTQAPLSADRPKLIPIHSPIEHFLTHLIDEFADEFCLYMVHHNRWTHSARDNTAGDRLAAELRTLLGPLQKTYSRWFSRRQVKRLSYLFSVAEEGFSIEGLNDERQPPSRLGFPETHSLLDDCFLTLLDQLNHIFEHRNTLVSSQYTLADASIYGQFSMNLSDPSTRNLIQSRSPYFYNWLVSLQQHEFPTSTQPISSTRNMEHLKPLLKTICGTFIPLMHHNLKAWRSYTSNGETVFNEAAFWKNRALFDGVILGRNYRTVVKTFQVKSWLALRAKWDELPKSTRDELNNYLPPNHGLDRDC